MCLLIVYMTKWQDQLVCLYNMDPSSSSQFVSSRNIGVYDPIHQFTIWEEHFKSNGDSSVYEPEMKLNSQVRV